VLAEGLELLAVDGRVPRGGQQALEVGERIDGPQRAAHLHRQRDVVRRQPVVARTCTKLAAMIVVAEWLVGRSAGPSSGREWVESEREREVTPVCLFGGLAEEAREGGDTLECLGHAVVGHVEDVPAPQQ
jgi:hypothetical protein